MASEVSICNRALAMLGANTITSLQDGSTESNVCNAVYADARDAVLRSHPWSCAIQRATLAQLSTKPVWGYDKAYSLPNDPHCLSVLEFAIQTQRLLNLSQELQIRGNLIQPLFLH